jgi:hypothetical protein
MVPSKIEPKVDPPAVQSKTKQPTTPVKVDQIEEDDVQMKSAENKTAIAAVKSDVEEEEEIVPKKKGRLIKNSTASKK